MAVTKRIFIAGDEWLYFKIYSGPKMLEKLLVNEIESITASLLKKELIDRFFFIRYTDPDHHIRLRLHLRESNRTGEVISLVNSILGYYTENRLVSKICIDTYKRELERYGAETIDSVEQFFYFDSILVINHLRAIGKADDGRWLLSLNLLNTIMHECNFSIHEKADFCSMICKNFEREFRVDQKVRIQLDTKFRQWRKAIDEVMLSKIPEIKLFISNTRTHLSQIQMHYKSNASDRPFQDLLVSMFHMHFNRLFRGKHRMQEFVMYYFLTKHYHSLIGRSKQKTITG